MTLDLTDPYHPPERKDVTKAGRTNKMVRWINPVLLMKEEEETKKTMQKEKRTRQHRVYKLGSQGLVDMEVPPDKIRDENDLNDSEEEEELGSDNNGREDAQSGVESEKVDPRGPENGETNDNEKEDDEFESNKIQIMELHSERPMVMFKERYYDCQWASNVGTEMLFIKHDPDDKNPLPILRTLEGDVDLLAASSQRIMATEVIVEEKREKNSKSKTHKKKNKGRRLRLKDLAIDVGPGADQERRETAKFLEELIYAKLERGELDAVTVDAQGRKSIWKWNEFVMLENRDRINKLKKIIRKGGEDAGEAVKQLAEIEEEEKLREENVELRHKLGGAWKYRYSDKKRKSVLARPAKKPKKGRPVTKKLRMNSPERATTTPGASGTPASGIGSMADSSLDEFDSEDEDDLDLEDESELEVNEEGESDEDDSDEDDSDEEDSELDDSEGSSTEGGDSEGEDSDEDSELGDSELDDIELNDPAEIGSSDEDGHRSSDEEQFSDEDEDAHTQGDEDTTMYDNLYD